MNDASTKPYLIRAIYEWCNDRGLTPYLAVQVDDTTRVPLEHAKNGEIVLNISHTATRNLVLGNDKILFSARFNGVSREIMVPVSSVLGIFARETGHGLYFGAEGGDTPAAMTETMEGPSEPQDSPPRGKPDLKIVK